MIVLFHAAHNTSQKNQLSSWFFKNIAYLCKNKPADWFMLFDLIFPEESQMYEAECIIAAVFFDEEELKSLGYEENSFEMNPSFIEANEFEKAFLLWLLRK